MFIDTRTKEGMIQSLVTVFGMTEKELNSHLEPLFSNTRNANEDEGNVDKDIKKFISKNLKVKPNEILFYHLTRRLIDSNNSENGINSGIFNLKKLLFTDNIFSAFLFEHGFKFEEINGFVNVSYKDKVIIDNKPKVKKKEPKDFIERFKLNEYEDEDRQRCENYLIWRMNDDYCVNGFLLFDFSEGLSHQYIGHLKLAPEFVQKLSEFVQDEKLLDDYEQRSKYMCLVYKLPFDVVMLDERDNLCTNEKLKIVLLSVIKYLCGKIDNLGLRLEDGKDIDGKYLINQYVWDKDERRFIAEK